MSCPPISTISPLLSGVSSAGTRYFSASRTAIGWVRVKTQRDRLLLESFGEVADHLERYAAGTDNDACPKLGDRHAGLPEYFSCLLA